MNVTSIRVWSAVHKWTSLCSTIFLLMLCLTGLPLVFHDEIDEYLNPRPALKAVSPDLPAPSLDSIVAAALAKHPGDVPVSLGFFRDRPAVVIHTAPTPRSPLKDIHRAVVDLRDGELSEQRAQTRSAFIGFVRTLHTDMFLGLPGALFLGAMAVVFLASIVSGIVVYAPFMRRLPYGTVRQDRSNALKWLDLHNLLGIATALWLLAVGATGAINTLHDIVTAAVRAEIALMGKKHQAGQVKQLSSVDEALATARRALPAGDLVSFFFPGAGFSTSHHYAVFMRGDRPITSKLFYAALIDAESGALTERLEMPLYAKILLLSQPLHFGDYGGLPLKILWAVLDIIAIVVLSSGIYLWIRKHRAVARPVIHRTLVRQPS